MKKIRKEVIIYIKKLKLKRQIIKSSNIVYKWLILQLLSEKTLDEKIYKLNNKKVEINCSTLLKKKHIKLETQFINIIDNFITYFLNTFDCFEALKDIISLCLTNDSEIFYSDKYLYNNDYIDYYIYNYNKMIVGNFYKNYLKMKGDLNDELKEANIDLENLNLNDPTSVENLTILLSEICFVNKNSILLLCLFKEMDDKNHNYYLNGWHLIFSNYSNNKDFILEYRKFKNKNI